MHRQRRTAFLYIRSRDCIHMRFQYGDFLCILLVSAALPGHLDLYIVMTRIVERNLRISVAGIVDTPSCRRRHVPDIRQIAVVSHVFDSLRSKPQHCSLTGIFQPMKGHLRHIPDRNVEFPPLYITRIYGLYDHLHMIRSVFPETHFGLGRSFSRIAPHELIPVRFRHAPRIRHPGFSAYCRIRKRKNLPDTQIRTTRDDIHLQGRIIHMIAHLGQRFVQIPAFHIHILYPDSHQHLSCSEIHMREQRVRTRTVRIFIISRYLPERFFPVIIPRILHEIGQIPLPGTE